MVAEVLGSNPGCVIFKKNHSLTSRHLSDPSRGAAEGDG